MDQGGPGPAEERQDSPSEGGPERVGIRDIERLRGDLRQLEAELEGLTDDLGAAVLDDDVARAAALEARLDALGARRAGLAAELAALEAAGELGERQRRRREAVEREGNRRARAAMQAELYEGWGTLLEHRAAVAEVALELERLRAAWPIDRARLETLRQNLAGDAGAMEPLLDQLEGSDDPEALREAARRCRALASAVAQPSRPPPEPSPPEWAPREADAPDRGTEGSPSEAADRPPSDPATPDPTEPRAALELPDRLSEAMDPEPPDAERAESAERAPMAAAGTAAPAAPTAASRVEPLAASMIDGPHPARPAEAATDGTIGEELRRLDEERDRLEQWAAALDARGDPLGVRDEVERQLAELMARRGELEARPKPQGPTREPRGREGAHWLRFMGLDRDGR